MRCSTKASLVISAGQQCATYKSRLSREFRSRQTSQDMISQDMMMAGGKLPLRRHRHLSPNCGDDDDGNGHDDDDVGHGDGDEDDDDDGGDYVCASVFLGSCAYNR